MLLERIYDEDLAQASYVISCQATGEAVVVDPRRDIDVYLRLAEAKGLRIAHVTETHIHADYLSGTRELAARADTRIHVSDEGGPDWTYGSGFDGADRMHDGDEIAVGNVRLRAVHTPGHTPEHLSFLVTDGAQAEEPGFLLSGDFDFVGDLGRPDLLDEAAGGVDTRFEGARQLFTSLRERAHAYFAGMKSQNSSGPALLGEPRVGIDAVDGFIRSLDGLELTQPRPVQPQELDGLADGHLVDVRDHAEHAAGHIPRSHHVSGGRARWSLDALPAEGAIVTYCQSGVRNSVVASALRRAGLDVTELDGSSEAWLRTAGREPATA